MLGITTRLATATTLREFSLQVTTLPLRGESFPQFLCPLLPFGKERFLLIGGRPAEPKAQGVQFPKMRP